MNNRSSQEKLLSQAVGFYKEQSEALRDAIGGGDVEGALQHSISLANELRTTLLHPENYYKLYTLITWELQHLAQFLADQELNGVNLETVYDIVQHEGNVLPRMYLLITVGIARMLLHPEQGSEVLSDLCSMVETVQHPIRGLFLRHYLLRMCKDKLQMVDRSGGTGEATEEDPEAHVRSALAVLLGNYVQAAQLWTRLRSHPAAKDGPAPGLPSASTGQLQGLSHDARCLRILVDAHLVEIAQLDGFRAKLHSEVVMPEFVHLLAHCEDLVAKAHLLWSFIDTFPDRRHMEVVEEILAVSLPVCQGLDIKPILQQLLRRLTAHAAKHKEEGLQSHLWDLFYQHCQKLTPASENGGSGTPLLSLLDLYHDLVVSAILLDPTDALRVGLALAACVDLLREEASKGPLKPESAQIVVNLLAAALTQECLVPQVLEMPHHASLMATLSTEAREDAATAMVEAFLAGEVAISEASALERLFTLIDPLVRDEAYRRYQGPEALPSIDALRPTADNPDSELRYKEHNVGEFRQRQEKVARLVHQIQHEKPQEAFQMLGMVRRYFEQGGPHRGKITLPTLVAAALRLAGPMARQAAQAEELLEGLLSFVNDICMRLASLDPKEALRLWLLSTCVADAEAGGLSGIANIGMDHVQQALWCLENEITDEKAQFLGFQLAYGSLMQVSCIHGEAFKLLVDRLLAISAVFSSLSLQARGLAACARLYWHGEHQHAESALMCLRGAMKLADAAVNGSSKEVVLFAEILDSTLCLAEEEHPEVTSTFLQALLALCIRHAAYADDPAGIQARLAFGGAAEKLRDWAYFAEPEEQEAQADQPEPEPLPPKACRDLPSELLRQFFSVPWTVHSHAVAASA